VRFRFLAIGVIAGMLAACTSGDAEPRPTPSPSPSSPRTSTTAASSSPTPTPTGPLTTGPNVRPGEKPPVYPALAKHHTADGALAFAIYYFKAFDWGYATNDSRLVAAISEPTCDGCRSYISALNSLEQSNEVLRGGRITFKSSSIAPNTYKVKAEYVADLVVDEQAVVVQGPSTTRTAASPVTNDHSLVFVSWISGEWKVVKVTAR
jgi:hypothetical protein